MEKRKILDHGYVALVEAWGSDERVIEAARMRHACCNRAASSVARRRAAVRSARGRRGYLPRAPFRKGRA